MKRFLPLLMLVGGCSFLVPGTNIRVGSPLSQVAPFTVVKQGDRYLYSNANLQVSYPATWGNGTDFLPGIGDLHSLVGLDIGTGGDASIYFDDAPAVLPLNDIYLVGVSDVRSVQPAVVDGLEAVRVRKHKVPRVDDEATPPAFPAKAEDQLLIVAINNGREFTLKLVTRTPLKGSQSTYEAAFEDMVSTWKWHKATPKPSAAPSASPTTSAR
ncbi:MAG: hypothetical protein JWM80_3076 [Cyanobacteria bacterium RYN_339]|nr:hypothetical protein [Cyanobacteria bacterium RYN_339]